MNFQAETVYHLYNQGNNKQIIFPRHQNYLFFLEKMRKHLMPFADILCYCLMPNHFNWLLYVKPEGAEIFVPKTSTGGSTLSGTSSRSFLPRQNLNQSIGIMLSSYTRAINKQEGWSGSIFRQETKAKNGWIDEFITVDKYQKGNFDFRTFPDNDYGFECFNYIHNNPVKAAITNRATEWKYSSAMDFAGMRSGTLCNQKLARELLLLP